MQNFFAVDWNGPAFELFGSYHLTALAVIVLINLSLLWLRNRGEQARRVFRYSLATVLIIDEISFHLWNISSSGWTVQTMLPLHLCSILVWLSAVMLVTRNYRIYEFAYLLGIAGAAQALLTPDAGIYGFPHYRAFQVMISHGAIVTAAVFMTVVEGFRPTVNSMKRVFIFGNLYMAAVFVLNQIIGSNYLFIAHKPATASLLDMLPAWPWYIVYIELLGVVFVLLLYAPFFIKDWRSPQVVERSQKKSIP